MNMDKAVLSASKKEMVKATMDSLEVYGKVELLLSNDKKVTIEKTPSGALMITGIPMVIIGMDDRFQVSMTIDSIYRMGGEVVSISDREL